MIEIRSIKDLAMNLGISKTTVSFVLSGQGDNRGISKETQERVIDMANKHGFRPSQLARNLNTGRTDMIGFVAPDLSDPFYATIFKGVADFFYDKGYVVIGVSTEEDEEKELHLIDVLLRREVDGLLLATSIIPDSDALNMLNIKKPVVLFDRENAMCDFPSVTVDNYQGAYKLTKKLISRGHKSIGLLSVSPHISSIKGRITGVRDAVRDGGLSFNNFQERRIDVSHLREQMRDAVIEFCSGKNPVTALILLNNVLGAEAVYCLNGELPISNKPALACFDDIDLFDFVKPPILSVVQPLKEIARSAAEVLYKLIISNDEKSSTIDNIEVKTTIKLRQQ